MERFSKYYSILITLGMVVLTNLAAGSLAADVLSYLLFSPTPLPETARPRASSRRTTRPKANKYRSNIRTVLSRNFFCSTCEPISLDDLSPGANGKGPEKKLASLSGAELLTWWRTSPSGLLRLYM